VKSFCKNREHEQIVRRLVEDAGGHVAGISFKGSSHIAVHVQLNGQHAEVIISCTSSDVNARHQVKANTRRQLALRGRGYLGGAVMSKNAERVKSWRHRHPDRARDAPAVTNARRRGYTPPAQRECD
jgi:hypothetical protein